MNSTLTYRVYEDNDIPSLLRLWEANTEWGHVTAEQWKKWNLDTPNGPGTVLVGADEVGEMRAQAVFTPSQIYAEDQTLKAVRTLAPVLDKSLRGFSSNHPMACLYRLFKQPTVREGYSLIYAFPNSSLKLFLQRYIPEFQLRSIGCVSTPTSDWVDAGDPAITICRSQDFGAEYDSLWLESRQNLPFNLAVVRSSARLKFRYWSKIALEARTSNGSLFGWAVFDPKTGLLLDCLARSMDDITSLLRCSLAWLFTNFTRISEAKAMCTPMLVPIFDALGFVPHNFEFLVGYEVLDPVLADSFDLNKWYFMPGD